MQYSKCALGGLGAVSRAGSFYYFHRDYGKKYGAKQISALKKFMKGKKFEASATSEGQVYAKLTPAELAEVKKFLKSSGAEAVLVKKLKGEYF